MKYVARPATLEDALYVADNLRKEDRLEVQAASGGRPPALVLEESLKVSREVYSATLEGDEKPFMLFGVADDPTRLDFGLVWLLATDRATDCKLMVAKAAKRWLKKWGKRYSCLHNYADTRNRLHLRWLKLMGFELTSRIVVHGTIFQHFISDTGGQLCANQSQSSQPSAPA